MISKVAILIALFGVVMSDGIAQFTHAAQPYKFGYGVKDSHGEQYRQEEGNGGNVVRGSYGFADAKGIRRQVDYVADNAGFRAQVKTNEPGTANQNPAAVHMVSNTQYAGGVSLGGLRYGGVGLGNVLVNGGLGYGIGANGPANGLVGRGLGNGAHGYLVPAVLGQREQGLGLEVLGGLGYTRYGY